MTFKPHAQTEESAAAADALRLRSGQKILVGGQGGWRNPTADIVRVNSKPSIEDGDGLDRDRGRKDASKKSVQSTTVVGDILALIAVVMTRALIFMGKMVLVVRSHSGKLTVRARQRPQHNPRELGHQEQGNQCADKARYGA